MATFKTCIFSHQQKTDGTLNVKLRITHHRKCRWVATNIFAKSGDYTRSLKIKNDRLLLDCRKLESDCIDICNKLGFEIEQMTVDELAARIKAILSGQEQFRLNFLQYMEQSVARMSEGTASGYKTSLAALKRYVGRETLDIKEITKAFMQGFVDFIDREPSQRGSNRKSTKNYVPQSKGTRAMSFYVARIKTIFERAKDEFNDEDMGIINIKGNPFKGIKVKQHIIKKKKAVPTDIIQKIIDLPPFKHKSAQQARDCFLLSFALMGMNSVDMLNSDPAKKDEIIYFRKKTTSRRTDLAEAHVRIEQCIKTLMKQYADPTGKKLFRFHLTYANRENFTQMLKRGMKEVGEMVGEPDMVFYAARHSLATIARTPEKEGGAGIDKYVVHEMLNHVDKEMKVTDIYLVKNWRILFDANKKVLDLFDWSAVQ